MRPLRVLLSRAAGIFRRGRRDDALRQEIDAHLDLLTEQYVRHGMSADDARLAARRAFGGVEQVKAAYRDQCGLPLFDAIAQDLRFALRVLTRDRGFALTAILVLGLGVGVNNMMFTIIYGHTLRQLPIDRPERVLFISASDPRVPERFLSYPDLLDLRGAQSFAGFVAFVDAPVPIGDEDARLIASMARMSPRTRST